MKHFCVLVLIKGSIVSYFSELFFKTAFSKTYISFKWVIYPIIFEHYGITTDYVKHNRYYIICIITLNTHAISFIKSFFLNCKKYVRLFYIWNNFTALSIQVRGTLVENLWINITFIVVIFCIFLYIPISEVKSKYILYFFIIKYVRKHINLFNWF